MNISVNTERILLKIKGLFEGVQADLVKIIIKFPLTNQKEFLCTIQTIQNDRFLFIKKKFYNKLFFYFSLTCNLIIPKQPVEGTISIDIKPKKILAMGDTDISGSIELTEKFKVYVKIFIFIDSKNGSLCLDP